MLRSQLGERAFFDAVRAYYEKHRHDTAVTDDLQAELERTSGQSLGWFFDQWLRRPGYPEISASWTYDSATREAIVNVSQGSRFGHYRFPLTIGVRDASGTMRRAKVELSGATASAQVRIQVGGRPAAVVLDPDVELLAAVTVNNP
jgi:aminopeptidase N